MPDVLTQTTAKAPPALNAVSDMPVIDLTKPAVEPATEPVPADKPVEADAKVEPKVEPAPAATVDEEPPWYKQRLSKIAEQRRIAEAEAKELRERVARMEAETAARIQPPAKPEEDPAPVKTEFPDPDAYTQAFAAWTARQEVRKVQEQDRKAQEERVRTAREDGIKTYIKGVHDTHLERTAKAKAELPDFDKVALREDVQLSFSAFFEIEKSSMGPQIMYAIGKDPTLATKLNTLANSDHSALVREIVDMEHTLKPKASVTKAPAPIEPLRSPAGSGKVFDPETATMEEYDAHLTPILNANRRPFAGRKPAK